MKPRVSADRDTPKGGAKPAGASAYGSRLALLLWALALVASVGAGIGGYTFRYAEGFSYLSSDPKTCVNCHIMRPQFAGWQKGSHHSVAVCVDCHLPHAVIPKFVAKAENGWRHSKAFTAQDFEEPITIKARGREILQSNCVRCHADMVERLNMGSPEGPGGVECVHCHSGVGHGDRAGLGGPLRPDELAEAR